MLSKVNPRSILAVILAAVFGRAATAIGQVIAAFYLTPEQFGVYATGVGVLIATGLFRGGGTGNHMLTMRPEEFPRDGGRMFRYSLVFSLLCLGLTLGAAWPVAGAFAATKHYPERELREVIVVLGVQFAGFIIGQYPRARMSADLRFSELSALDVVSGALKLSSTWALAAWGWGSLALAAPMLAMTIFENGWTWSRCRLSPWELRVSKGWFTPTLQDMRLPLVMAVLATLNSQTDALIGSVLLPVTVIGYYFFATQLASQPASLVANSLRSILSPATAQVRGDPERERAAIRDAFSVSMVFSPMVSMAIPAVFDSFERAVWHGKWEQARWPIFILSATLTYPTVVQLIAAPLAGIRNWGAAIRLDSGRAFAKVVGAAVASIFVIWLQPDVSVSATLLATFVGLAGAAMATYEIFRVASAAGMSRSSIAYELYSTPLAATMSALAAAGLAHSVVEPLHAQMPTQYANIIECTLAASLYALLSLILLRFGYTMALQRLIDLLPGPVASIARKLTVL